MLKLKLFKLILIALPAMMVVSVSAQNGPRGVLKAGAAKVDITPAESELPANSFGILDRVFARAIVVDNGHSKAALVTVDVASMGDNIWTAVTERVERELGMPRTNVFMTSTHTHSGPRLSPDFVAESVFSAIKNANAALQPARMGYGNGVSYINVNRNMFNQDRGHWWEGANYDGITDKTVAVIYFEALNGDPIAVFYNYAMHAVTAGVLDMISGDTPGAVSRYIETSLNDKIVAVWSTGAQGDQNPIFFQQTYDLRDIRIAEYAARGEDISNAMPPGGTGMDRNNPRIARLMEEQKQLLDSYGQMLGEEVKRVMREMRRFETNVTIHGANKIITVPGRKRLNSGRAGYEGIYEDAAPIDIRLSLVMIDDIPLTGVNAEVFAQYALRLKQESPYSRTILAEITNGSSRSGYIPNDEAFAFQTFEVLSSSVKPGTESAIINGILDLIHEATH